MYKVASDWKEYEIIATGNGQKLERWGDYYILRPDPQVIWPSKINLEKFDKLNAIYKRNSSGGGFWDIIKNMPEEFKISYKDLKFSLKLMGFKHTGLFPEQAYNWDYLRGLIRDSNRQIKVLNLFAYTGGASVALAKEGAFVCHVDSAKNMCERAKVNSKLSDVSQDRIRYIVDDCMKFVQKEIRRGNFYDAIIMDPPSYGRGKNGELWKLEDSIDTLVKESAKLLSDNRLFFHINSYTTGLQPIVIQNILNINLQGGVSSSYELALDTNEEGVLLPCGCSGVYKFK